MVNHNTSADMAETGGLDALALALDHENSALLELEYRLNGLRLALIDGNPEFVQRAANDADGAATAAAALGEPREVVLRQVVTELGLDPTTMISTIPEVAPEGHRELLGRLLRELLDRTRAIRTQRDAISSLADNGQRSLSRIVDLNTTPPTGSSVDLTSEGSGGNLFVGEF